MKLAAIDIGTNSIRLLISNYKNSRFTTIERKINVTRIGKNLETSGMISPEPARKTSAVLSSYLTLMEKKGVEKYRIIGTSAVRNAKNKDWFIEYISKNLGIKIEPVSGREEAYFSFYGALKGPGLNNLKNSTGSMVKKKVLVIDIGGGSSELILGEQSGIPGLAFSIKMGCVNLTEKFIRSEKPGRDELIRLEKYVWSKLNETVKKVKGNKPSLIIGTGGTITTLAAIDLKLEVYDSEKIHGYLLKLNKIGEIYKYLCSLDSNERQKIPGLQFDRADIIISGTAVLLAILKLLEMDVIKVSERDILDGIVYTLVDF